MEIPLNDIDLILCYVLKGQGDEVGKKLNNELSKNALVIAEKFPLHHLKEIKQIKSSIYGFPAKVFVYQIQKELP